ncbi:TPA: hypothetical protein P0E37_000109 [Vibrio campbellii]|uniref:hypothetical protein n=1 Tax=Vibrio campbellii TaxID=680 RepID=UPI001F1C440E|nr:hypothetical protein [Vibrio campbellii]MCE7732136.1 hypothetical protein [Vibrio campbellii]HDM8225675.1 hypothetical protein [Vibrio campbellii]
MLNIIMKTKFKYLFLIGMVTLFSGCSSALKDDYVYIVHEISEGNNIQYILPFSKAINQEIKNESVSWIHGINVYHTDNLSRERLYQLKIDMENIYDFSPNFIDIGNYDDKQLLLWEVHVSDTRLVNCQVWEVPTYGHFSMSDSELDNFANETACSSLELW